MEKLNLNFEGVSKNLRYIFTSGGIHDLVENKSVRYESLSLIDGINILQEVQDFEYKTNQISLQEHSSNPRRAMISLTNILLPENSVTVLKEWENHFGDKLLMLNESVDSLIIESRINEAWEGVKTMINEYWGEEYVNKAWNATKDIAGKAWDATKSGAKWVKDKAVQGAKWVGDKVSQGWKWIKDKATAAWNCLKNDFVECLMEGLRSAMYSVVGIAIETFLAVTGIGAPIPMILWGLMLIWDIYKMFSGKYNGGEYAASWMDIFFDVVGVATAGVGSAALAPIRGAFKGLGGVTQIFSKGIKMGGKVGGLFKQVGSFLAKGGSKIMGALESGAKWISKNFGITFLERWAGKAKGVVDDIVKVVTGKSGTTVAGKTATKTAGKTVGKTTGKEGLSTFGKIKKGYSNAFDSTVGKIGGNKVVGKTTMGNALSKTAQTAVPVGVGMAALGVNPLTGKPYAPDELSPEQMMAMSQQNNRELEKDVTSLTSGGADYEAAGLI
jgi:hypothetical protein